MADALGRRADLWKCQKVATRPDTPGVGTHEDEHLRRFVAARERGDAGEMRRWWEELVIDFADRIDGLVAGAHRGRLDRDEHELAAQLALAKFATNLVSTFRGASMGELVNATKRLATNICIDVQQASMQHRARFGVSLDELRTDLEGDHAAAHWAEAAEALHQHERDGDREDARDFVSWALPQLGEREHRLMELTLQGAPIPEIMEELDVSQANAYQLRSRAMSRLRELKEGYDA